MVDFWPFGKKKADEAQGEAAGAGGAGGEAVTPDPNAARNFFDRAQGVQDSGNYGYAMTLWLQGIRKDPTSVPALEKFMSAAASFGAQNPKGPTKDQLALFPGKGTLEQFLLHLLQWGSQPKEWSTGLKAAQAAQKLKLVEPAYWVGERVLALSLQDKKTKKDTFITLMRLFADIGGYDRAVQAGEAACRLDATDGKLINETRNLAAQAAMNKGGYEKAGTQGGFRAMIKDAEKQRQLEEQERGVRTEDVQERVIQAAKADYDTRPADPAAVTKYAKALVDRGTPADEKLAFEVLMRAFEATKTYRFKQAAGDLKLKAGRRKLREMREAAEADAGNEAKREAVAKAARQLLEAEIGEFAERVANYPTDLNLKFELGKRYAEAGEYEKAIEQFQLAQAAPGIGVQVLHQLGQSFQRIGWTDESEGTFRRALEVHPTPNDDLGLEIRYGLLVTLQKKAEEHRDAPAAEEALKLASGIAVQQINYKDVRSRREAIQGLIKSLRGG
ncbi:MAG: hypothetical protein IBJ11_00650 [Phycisphaerales bacterium]|nr:hypothetical protein [Phycisphaerales bacterium]